MADLKPMTWSRRGSSRSYYSYSRLGDLKVVFLITRTPYGKSGYTFEAFWRNADCTKDTELKRIPLSFSSRLKDTKACVDRFIEREL
jgi:hypothetical protein